MKAVLVNYNHDPKDWWVDHDMTPTIYDRSDDGVERRFTCKELIKSTNTGNVDYDKLSYLVDDYDHLPEVFLWGKTNLFKYISEEEFDDKKGSLAFTPLLTQSHKTYSDKRGAVCYYQDGMYHERNERPR